MITIAVATPVGAVEMAGEPADALVRPELIVTGEKIARPLQRTTASVSVTSADTIAKQDLLTVYDVLDRIPNVMVDGNRTTFSIRGIDAFNVSGSGEGPLASVYLDGAALPRLVLASGPLDLFDISRVEVFRGPQSTLQGRNSLAGVVLVNTVDPDFDWSGKARLLLSQEGGGRRAAMALGGPVVQDQLAFRISGEALQADGFARSATTGRYADQRQALTMRGKILITPDAVPKLSVLAAVTHDRHERGAFYIELDPPFAGRDRLVTSDFPDVRQVGSTLGTVTARYDLSPQSKLTLLSNLSRFRFRSSADADRSATAGQISLIDEPTTSFQNEIRFQFRQSWATGLIGAFFLREKRDYLFSSHQRLSLKSLGVPWQLQAAGISPETVDTVIALYGGALPIQNSLSQPQSVQNFAAFADFSIPLTSRVHVRLGLRYDHEAQTRSVSQTAAIDQALPDPAQSPSPALAPIVSQLNSSLRTLVAGANGSDRARRVAYDAWLPLMAVTYDLSDKLAISGSIRRGYRAGGSGINQQRGEAFRYGPEYTTSYEASMRSNLFDRRLTFNANLFWTDWEQQQIALQLTAGSLFDSQIVNAGRSRLYGFELEASVTPIDALSFQFGSGYTRTRFSGPAPHPGFADMDLQGKEFPRAPRWTMSAGASYARCRGFVADINAHYRSPYFQTLTDQNDRDIPGRTIISGKVGWKARAVSAYLTARNIFNVQQREQFFLDVDGRKRGAVSDPRILGFVLEGHI
ncbi:TonB-dependent receptor [Sphingobium agri]|uniref:TonB-dependent receptor n=1 Tax=Sphingobium agri TaxID=2933566 RepID=A0ABT0DUP3_9SPHN|nr:TonB-dependent receptor [Sphingobium agri]MCK0530667.1 TonB-dependent receptor [Sphingobium agri]